MSSPPFNYHIVTVHVQCVTSIQINMFCVNAEQDFPCKWPGNQAETKQTITSLHIFYLGLQLLITVDYLLISLLLFPFIDQTFSQ